ncbi:MAG: alpha/beta hydrolase [Planctomycetota bacterium]
MISATYSSCRSGFFPTVRALAGLLIGCILAGDALGSDPETQVPETQVIEHIDLVYGRVGDVDLKLDLYVPKQSADDGKDVATSLPTVVMIHGGGWQMGNKRQLRQAAKEMATEGFVAATVGYRLAPEHRFPAAYQDVACAVRFMRAHAGDYRIDSKRIAAMGYSAGAHLAMMLGTVDPGDDFAATGGWEKQNARVQAVVSYFGPTDLTTGAIPEASRRLVTDFMGGTRAQKPDVYRRASPATFLDPSDPPMLLFQGTRDPLVPFQQAIRMADLMTQNSVGGRVELLVGASHGWSGETLERTNRSTIEFMRKNLR